jgi:hypothetical protein
MLLDRTYSSEVDTVRWQETCLQTPARKRQFVPPIADGWSQTFTSHTEIQHLSHCGNRCPSNKARPGKGHEADEGDHACIQYIRT